MAVDVSNSYPLGMTQSLVSFPIIMSNGDFLVRYAKLPEGNYILAAWPCQEPIDLRYLPYMFGLNFRAVEFPLILTHVNLVLFSFGVCVCMFKNGEDLLDNYNNENHNPEMMFTPVVIFHI